MPQPPALPPHVQLIQMGTGHWVAGLIYTAANIRLADHLADGPKRAADLAGPTESHPRALHRFMRALASIGLLTQNGDLFGLSPLGEALKSDAPGAAHATILTMTGRMGWKVWGEFPHALRTGGTAMEHAYGMPFFDYLAQDPAMAAMFSQTMVGIHGGEPPTVAAAYTDFANAGTIVDVGGATGNMLAHILTTYPQPKGVLYDLPHVVPEATALLRERGVADRVTIQAGSFFDQVPEGGDIYILSHIIHDWTPEQCATILGNCRKAMKPGAKLLLVEFVLPEGDAPHLGKLIDMVMLAFPGGEERTPSEYDALLAASGLKMTRVIPTASDVSVVEAERA